MIFELYNKGGKRLVYTYQSENLWVCLRNCLVLQVKKN